jgi:hypothetical protein
MPRVSAEVSYQHRWLVNFTATDNLNVGAAEAFSTATTTWLRPNWVLQPRFVRFSAQINF